MSPTHTFVTRRRLMGLAGAGGLGAALAACIPGQIPIAAETAGPYPEDRSGNSAMYRRDIREAQTGVPLTVALMVLNPDRQC